MIDGEAKRHALNKDEIASMKETDKSLMPEGFEKTMKAEELTDLLEFLTQKGKYVPLPLDKVATIVSTKGMFFDEAGTTERLIFPDWKPKTFDEVPFVLVDPEKDTTKNVVMLYGPQGNDPAEDAEVGDRCRSTARRRRSTSSAASAAGRPRAAPRRR